MRDSLKSILLRLPGFQALCRWLTRDHVRVFMYHRFATGRDDHPGWPDQDALRRQFSEVRRHHPVWDCARHLEHLGDHQSKAGGAVVLTTDDGYRDFYTEAFPVLQEFGLSGTLFVTTGFVDGRSWMWWDKLAHLCRSATAGVLTVVAGGRELELDFTTEAARLSAYHSLADRCRFLHDREKRVVITDLAEQAGFTMPESPPPGNEAVSWDEIREMSTAGIEILPHTDHHPILTRLGPDDVRLEVEASQRRLADEIGPIPPVFCYPQGGPADFNTEICSILADCGIDLCYIAYQDPARENDHRTMPRYCATGNMEAFQWQLCGAEYLVHRLRILRGKPFEAGENYWQGAD